MEYQVRNEPLAVNPTIIKVIGAGGGGFLLFYVEKEKQEGVMEAMRDLLYIPFSFENGGTQVVYYSPETFEKKG